MSRSIQIINQSSISEAELETFMQNMFAGVALFEAAWGINATLTTTTGWPVTLVDEPSSGDPQGALGFHDVDSNFIPYARCFVELAKQDGIPWSVVVSHEVFEMLADPRLNATTFVDGGNGQSGYIIYEEVADPVEKQYSVIGQTAISNFVYPGWYIPSYTGQVDNLRLLTAPLQLASGGYASYDKVLYASGWLQAVKAGTRRIQRRLK